MQVSRDLNLTMNLEYEGLNVSVHSIPVSKVIWEQHWRLFRDVYDDLTSGGSLTGALTLAKTILLDLAKKAKREEGARELLNAIGAGTFVSTGGKPDLLANANIDDDLKTEIENRILFFLVYKQHLLPTQRKEWMETVSTLLNLDFVSSPATEWFTSSPTSTMEESTGETVSTETATSPSFPI